MSSDPIAKKRAPGLRLSVEQIEALAPIGKRIREHWETAIAKAALSRANGDGAVKEALLCGKALLEAKAGLEHGHWLPWLERHCAEVFKGILTAQRWMRLAAANTSGVTFLEEAHSMTAAYRMVGILPALDVVRMEGAVDGECVVVARAPTWEGFAGRLGWLREAAGAARAWPIEERRRLVEELRPLVALYRELEEEA